MNSFAASEEFLELVKSALLAALEGEQLLVLGFNFSVPTAGDDFQKLDILLLLFFVLIRFFFWAALGPGSLFGLVTFSHKIGFYDVQGPIPVVKNIFIPPESDGTIPIELEDAMPLLSFLAPVC